MNRIQQLFKKPGGKLIPYVTAGYPSLNLTTKLVLAMEKGGADMIELGLPFSDPLADGPVIQASSQVALKNGVNTRWVLEQVEIIRKSSQIPIALMGYINPILKYGDDKFFSDCQQVGVDGIIVPDLPIEEAKDFVLLSKSNNISPILLIAPNTPNDRIRKISQMAGDLVYCVAILGVTGEKLSKEATLVKYLSRVRENSNTPFIVGFGIKTHQDVERINRLSDGAVVGTAFVEKLRDSNHPEKTVLKYVKELKGMK